MALSLYDDSVPASRMVPSALEVTRCVFCGNRMDAPIDEGSISPGGSHDLNYVEIQLLVLCCEVCGWWTAQREHGTELHRFRAGACGSLRELDLADQAIPIDEIRSYLAARYDARFNVDPSVLEDIVGSVYRDLGYRTRVVGRSGDGGIDVMLDSPDGRLIGVQVKRHRQAIRVEHIRALTGALYLKSLASGMFVTTSRFTAGASSIVQLAHMRGIAIELVDGVRFYEALGIAQQAKYKPAFGRSAEYYAGKLIILEDDGSTGKSVDPAILSRIKLESHRGDYRDGAKEVYHRELLAPRWTVGELNRMISPSLEGDESAG